MVGCARQVVVLADSTKIGAEARIRFADLDDIDVLVTDKRSTMPMLARWPGRRRGRGRVIVTLTANPSHDRTVTLAGPLERGAVQRVDAVTSQAGGKGVNISRASVSAGIPSIAIFPAGKDDPFVLELLAAGIDSRPVPHDGVLGSTSPSPSPTARPPS